MKPDFDVMSIAELKGYVLSHRNDDDAFYKLADRLEASFNDSEVYPAPDGPEAIALMESAIRKQVQKLEDRKTG